MQTNKYLHLFCTHTCSVRYARVLHSIIIIIRLSYFRSAEHSTLWILNTICFRCQAYVDILIFSARVGEDRIRKQRRIAITDIAAVSRNK